MMELNAALIGAFLSISFARPKALICTLNIEMTPLLCLDHWDLASMVETQSICEGIVGREGSVEDPGP